jgi:glycerol uptake facilitator protein
MDRSLLRAYLVELVGTFALVYFGAGIVCVDHMTSPAQRAGGGGPMLEHQPGLVGIALAQGLILTAVLSVSLPLSGGYHNPAITLMLWVFNRLDHLRTSWFIGAQVLGAFLAGMCLRYTFTADILVSAHVGTPHLNPLAFPHIEPATLATGSLIELVLTFFLVFAIFGMLRDTTRLHRAAIGAGLALTACVLVGYRLTGAATNPARWFGTVLWEAWQPDRPATPSAFADMFVYLAGPVVGALLAGLFYFKVIQPAQQEGPQPMADSARPNEPHQTATASFRARK